jgi:2',3'-cyclic-nucleotide 2'-phosphodiesterase (5'-nucleotidase family)
MKFVKKIIGIIFITTIPITSICVSACSPNYEFEQYMDVITINDFHGAAELVTNKDNKIVIPGIEYLASEINDIRSENYKKTGTYDSTQVILNGDIFQGTGFSELTYGDSVAELFQTLGVHFSSIGNHEFDWGQDFLDLNQARQKKHMTFQQMGDFTFLSCNIHKTSVTGDLIN